MLDTMINRIKPKAHFSASRKLFSAISVAEMLENVGHDFICGRNIVSVFFFVLYDLCLEILISLPIAKKGISHIGERYLFLIVDVFFDCKKRIDSGSKSGKRDLDGCIFRGNGLSCG